MNNELRRMRQVVAISEGTFGEPLADLALGAEREFQWITGPQSAFGRVGFTLSVVARARP
jgi:hypothetical protein